jgi:putative ABC transport system permease protein
MAGVGGTVLAWLAVGIFAKAAPSSVPHAASARLDPLVLAATVVISFLAGTLAGLAPAVQASRTNLVDSIKSTETRWSSATRGVGFRQVFICSEVALTCVLLVCSVLVVRTVVKLLDEDLGFRRDHLLTLRLAPSTRNNPQAAAAAADTALREVSTVPGVVSAAYAAEPPLMGPGNALIAIRDYPTGPDNPPPHADIVNTSSSYFATLAIPLLRGRIYSDADAASGNRVVLVDHAFAQRFWPGEEAVGKQLGFYNKPWSTVIGVVGTVRTRTVATESQGTVYFPAAFAGMSLIVRSGADPRALAAAIRQRLQATVGTQAIYDVKTMDERISDSIGQQRFAGIVLMTFAGLALVFAAVGLFSVTSNSVTVRVHEIGVRMALGAQRGDILRLVLRQGLATALVGVAVGIVAALGLTRLVANLLFGLDAADPATYAAVVVLLTVVVAFACYIPASRATTVDSTDALRS